MKAHILILPAILVAVSCHRVDMPHTDRTRGLIKELLTKLDSADVYAARAENRIAALKDSLAQKGERERYELYLKIAASVGNYNVDSSLVYSDKAIDLAAAAGSDSLLMNAEIQKANRLALSGYFTEAKEILEVIPRASLHGNILESYYTAWTNLYHNLYIGESGPLDFKKKYRANYNVYRDSLLALLDTTSGVYLRNMLRKEAREGNFAEARRYNAMRFAMISDPRSQAYATSLYDRFAISYLYEHKLTGEAVDDLLESAILEVENGNKDVASLLRVETLLVNANLVKAAKKVSDFYYSQLSTFGSRKRIVDSLGQTMRINERNLHLLLRSYRVTMATLVIILLLIIALVYTLVSISRSRSNAAKLNESLKQSRKITRGYVGVVFQLYSSYIKRLDTFRTKVHSSLRRGQVEQALQLTLPSGDISAGERRELYRNFDTAFVDIFPDFISTVNGCLKPEEQIVPKRTEILNTELRILALIKLGIEDSAKIAEMLHCSVKTVYNLRSGLKLRLRVSEEEFARVISEL